MEKTTKKRKKSKSMKRRIGIIAVGGLSLVLTICLSVGATLAWFAGSTWSSNQLFMGGPVYVEMAGLGNANGTNADGSATNDASWKGGSGNLTVQAAAARSTGTVNSSGMTSEEMDHVLLPGQKFEIYSQARVFSTAYTTNAGTNTTASNTSGANVTNTSNNGESHVISKGKKTTTTTSVLRARFSVSVDFDPTVGFNNFTDEDYADNYPVQSEAYTGHVGNGTATQVVTASGLSWDAATTGAAYKASGGTYETGARRDFIPANQNFTTTITAESSGGKDDVNPNEGGLHEIRAGVKKSAYAWKFVSESVYNSTVTAAYNASNTAQTVHTGKTYVQMGYPFNGQDKSYGENGYYGVWILGADKKLSESDAHYKARCNAYIDSYVEEYVTEYDEIKTRTIGASLASLENSLNQSFVNLVNDSSDSIINGKLYGMTKDTNGVMQYASGTNAEADAVNASWLYIDPKIGNDTNTNELSTSTGGWWYLVECDTSSVKNNLNRVALTHDSAYVTTPATSGTSAQWSSTKNVPTNTTADYTDNKKSTGTVSGNTIDGTWFTRNTSGFSADDESRLYAKLYEINPLINTNEQLGTNVNEGDITKVVSFSFPFVNGTSPLPGDALTNVFANATITIQISFQALQAFFPYSATIDSMDYTNPLLGTAKALNIKNAIPIYNEAFDYQEVISNSTITGL